MPAVRGEDFIDFDSLLSEQEKLVRKTVRQFARERIMPIIGEHFREARFPLYLVAEMGELGLLGANLQGYGCADMSAVEHGLVMQELERADSGMRSFASVQGSLVMWPILEFGSEEQKRHWLPLLQAGKAIGCFGLTEPDFGSNPSGIRTRAVRDGDSFVLDGEKTWITSGGIADIAVVWAREGDEIRGFLVERGTPGFTTSNIHGKWSMRALVTSSLAFASCRIPAENALPGAVGLKTALACLNEARFGIGWGCLGAAGDCFETAREYVLQRKQFNDRPIASHQLIQGELAWMATEISKAQLLAHHIAKLKSQGRLHHSQISMLKRNNAWMALEVARRCRDLLGANGITDDYPIFRHMANLETVKTYEGTDNIHALVIGERLTGVSAYS